MSDFHFLRPWWLAALPLLAGLLWLLWKRRLRGGNWRQVCDPALLPHLLIGRSLRRTPWPLWLMAAGAFGAVLALAGPTWKRLPQPLFQSQSALVICLDLSRSMQAADLQPSRLVRARLKVQDILRQRREGQTALVAFAGDAFALTPLTDDSRTLESLLGTLEPDLMPVQGSAPGRALELGAELLKQAGLRRGTLLLVTDEDRPRAAEESARKLSAQGMDLQVLGVGTPEGAPLPLPEGGFFKDASGSLVIAPLDEPALERLAAAGGGRYRRLSIDDDDFSALLAGLQSRGLDSAEQARSRLGDRWEEAGVWLLWPLALLAACAFRRGWLMAAVLLILAPHPASALSWQELWSGPDRRAEAEFRAGRYDEAARGFQDPRWKAGALYKAGRFEEALKALPESENADDWYNRGNALARAGRLQEALQAYDRSLSLKPGDDDALTNRRLVEEALKKQQDGQQKQEEQGQKEQGGSQDKEQGAEKPRQDGASSDQNKASDSSKAPPSDDAGQPQESQNSHPSHKSQPSPEQQTEQASPATPEELQQRQLEQRLQSIPDDPGGLLRRKFLYQYRRRGQQLETDRPW